MSEPTAIDEIVENAFGPLSRAEVTGLPDTRLGTELADLLGRLNGFYLLDKTVLVRGTGSHDGNVVAWNAADGWRTHYADLADGLFFFAEDIFGGQFALRGEDVVVVDPETGEADPVAQSIEEWAAWIIDDWNVATGYPLAKAWQDEHGELEPGERLVPITPFVMGGEFELENLRVMDDERGMRIRGDLALQIRDVPDGEEVEVDFQ